MQKDLILSEVDLPMSKGVKMLKYIMRDKQLRRIPVINEVSIVVKCLKFGAADYLSNAVPVETAVVVPSEHPPDAPGTDDRKTDEFQLKHMLMLTGEISPFPKKSELKIDQLPTPYPWHSFGGSSSAEIKVSKVDHRETVLMKFRQKRKGRCFDKKIRPAYNDDVEEEEEDDEEQIENLDFSPCG
ncbi:hypothetical protein RND71_005261 [Anisodus tanguticus]|uniref:Uncharacterized protein n=1 Tax=Anisodus tanguticus TaxID=243964 RepID=A0AAE1SRJ3_9SOLA|nr:hypothetical protein RND71_005261 [Anisodus tanguticus]